jgi:hypothetical protein
LEIKWLIISQQQAPPDEVVEWPLVAVVAVGVTPLHREQ